MFQITSEHSILKSMRFAHPYKYQKNLKSKQGQIFPIVSQHILPFFKKKPKFLQSYLICIGAVVAQ